MIDLGRLRGDPCSTATGINAHDQVVGESGKCGVGGHGFLWQHGTLYNLNDLLAPSASGLRVHGAFYINDRGEIYGVSKLTNGDDRAILLIPQGQG